MHPKSLDARSITIDLWDASRRLRQFARAFPPGTYIHPRYCVPGFTSGRLDEAAGLMGSEGWAYMLAALRTRDAAERNRAERTAERFYSAAAQLRYSKVADRRLPEDQQRTCAAYVIERAASILTKYTRRQLRYAMPGTRSTPRT